MTHWIGWTLAAALSVQAADKLAGGPFVINVGPRTATVAWIVESGQARLGASPDALERSAPALRVDKVSYTGLQAGKTYHYDVNGTPEGKGQFKTPPAGPSAFSFVVYGDTRTRHEVHQRVVNAMLEHAKPDFVLHTGDLVQDGADSAQWPIFFNIEKELLRNVAFFPSLGNHERNNRQYYEFFDVKTPYYSFDWGLAHFVVLNSDIGNAAASNEAREAYWSEQVRWLEEDLAKSQKAEFRFLIAHHPPMTAVKSRQGGNKAMTDLMPMLEKYNLTAGFFGHDHNYQHHFRNGVHYVVTGGGGAPLYPVDAPIEGTTVKVESIEHFVSVSVEPGKASIQALAVDGRIIETVDFAK